MVYIAHSFESTIHTLFFVIKILGINLMGRSIESLVTTKGVVSPFVIKILGFNLRGWSIESLTTTKGLVTRDRRFKSLLSITLGGQSLQDYTELSKNKNSYYLLLCKRG